MFYQVSSNTLVKFSRTLPLFHSLKTTTSIVFLLFTQISFIKLLVPNLHLEACINWKQFDVFIAILEFFLHSMEAHSKLVTLNQAIFKPMIKTDCI